jgi:hypothetical protein
MSKLSEKFAAFFQDRPRLQACAAIAEGLVKKPIFGCQDCGQCILSYTALTCCMRCPKQMRNGPCGGTNADGTCEVYPDRLCRWWLIHKRAKWMHRLNKLRKIQIPVDRRFEHTSAWLNVFAGKIEPPRW